MLGKLLKHEFRATGRIMLLIYGALVILAVLGNLAIRFVNVTDSTFLSVVFAILIVFFVIGIVAACVMTAVMMIGRFYRSLLGPQGYLTHTLPVSVHAHVWSKLIAALAWIIATVLVVWVILLLTLLIQSGTDLGSMFEGFPTWAEIRQGLIEEGATPGDLTGMILESLVIGLLGLILTCLHFYAAMAIGHAFAKNKVLMSIVVFIAISFVFNTLASVVGAVGAQAMVNLEFNDLHSGLHFAKLVFGYGLGLSVIEGLILYWATVLGLKKGLNLA